MFASHDVGAFGALHVGEDGGVLLDGVATLDGVVLLDGVVENLDGDAVDDGDGAGGRGWHCVVGDDGEDCAGGRDWIEGTFDIIDSLRGRKICRSHGDQCCRYR